MSWILHRYQHQLGLLAASDIVPRRPVKLTGTAETIVLAATAADRPFGVTGEASALRAERVVTYDRGNVVKAVAAASIAANAEVTVGSDNGALGPTLITASAHWAVGIALEAANPGEVFSLYVAERKV